MADFVKTKKVSKTKTGKVTTEKVSNKVARDAAKAQNYINKYNAKAEYQRAKANVIKAKKGTSKIEATGKAVATATAPTTTAYAETKTVEATTAQKALNRWNNLMSGNPDQSKGADGTSQGNSTTTSSSGGSMEGESKWGW